MVPTTAVALAFSSMTQESRYAGFAWFSMWVVGSVTYFTLWTATQLREQLQNQSQYQGRGARIEAMAPWNSFKLFSPYETLGYLQQQIFGLAVKDPWTWAPWIAVAIVSVAGYGFAYWKVSRVLKA
jgi:hypothetical protein